MHKIGKINVETVNNNRNFSMLLGQTKKYEFRYQITLPVLPKIHTQKYLNGFKKKKINETFNQPTFQD